MNLDIRRILLIAGVIAATGVGAVFLAISLSRETVAYGQKCGGSYCWGYRLDQYRFPRRTILALWGTWGLNLRYQLPPLRIERATDDRWLATDRAIYLNLWLRHGADTDAQDQHLRVVYDFERGNLNVSAPAALWRLANFRSSNPAKNWLTDGQFEKVLTEIEP